MPCCASNSGLILTGSGTNALECEAIAGNSIVAWEAMDGQSPPKPNGHVRLPPGAWRGAGLRLKGTRFSRYTTKVKRPPGFSPGFPNSNQTTAVHTTAPPMAHRPPIVRLKPD